MSVKLTGVLSAPLSTELGHASGAKIHTTAPKDDGGSGNLFSPTDLFAAALGSCGMTVMSLYAEKNKIVIEQLEFEMEKVMSETPPRRVQKLTIHYKIKTPEDDATLQKIIAAAKACPVRNSLHPDIEVTENFSRI